MGRVRRARSCVRRSDCPGGGLIGAAGASGDGSVVFFVSSTNDGCFVPTNGSQAPSCLGLPGQIASVAMSRDQNSYAFVFLNGGQRDNRVGFVDLRHSTTAVYRLVSPATDGGTTGTVLFTDTLDFTANSRFLLYDNFNVLTQADGSRIGVWSISAIDFSGGLGFSLIPPARGFDIANPSVARTSDDYFTFEAVDQVSGKSDIYAVRLTADTGYFWFFDANNVEIIVKALNGCGFNSRFWTFAGGLTNVQVTMTVTDTQTGAVKTYTNPLNQAFQPLQDTAAFVCP